MPASSDFRDYYPSLSPQEILTRFKTSHFGLSNHEVLFRQKEHGLNILSKKTLNPLSVLNNQITGNPLLVILAIATTVSYLLGQQASAYYIFAMIILSLILGFFNEYAAEKTIESLLTKITPTAIVLRNGEKNEVPVSHLTVGDLVLISAGNIFPADIRLIESNNLETDESVLTGESKSVYKISEAIKNNHLNITNLTNIGFMGTNVESGSGKGIVIKIGENTQFGQIAQSTTFIRPTTEFQNGLNKFGNLIIKVILILTLFIFSVNSLLGHPVIESLLFALAIAVGLTPELLPVIVTVCLSHGAGKLAKKHVVVKRLISIENLGNMDILCTDKTGTITEGKIRVVDYISYGVKLPFSLESMSVLCNSAIIHHKVVGNGIDTALWEHAIDNNLKIDKRIIKLVEEPFDYNRKMMYSILKSNGQTYLVAKGAPEIILSRCTNLINRKDISDRYITAGNDGFRVIAVAYKELGKKDFSGWQEVTNMKFAGLITFLDVPKLDTKDALVKLNKLNVTIKVVTGDSENVTRKVAKEVGLEVDKVITGDNLDALNDKEFVLLVNRYQIFCRVNPSQKLRIIQALQKCGHTVGYLGDGINDLPALHNADVGISVNTAIDVAKDAANVVLLRKSLHVLADGIIEGRKTFNNTIKYILMSTSSNFGNMFSAAGASFLLPFLPMTPLQILLNNAIYDLSQISIPSDNVDSESLLKPRHWNIDFIKNYMIFFGPLSSIYDFITFGVMFYFFRAQSALFQTGWFIESICTQILVIFIIRTSHTPFIKSKPGKWLILTSLSLVTISVLLPFTPFATHLGFVRPPLSYYFILIILVGTYLLLIETVKNIFLRKYNL